MKHLTRMVLTLILFGGFAFAQDEPLPVTIVLPDSTEAPFRINASGNTFQTYYQDGKTAMSDGGFSVSVGGTSQRMPLDLIARADLVDPGTETIWRFTLRDGRIFDGAVAESDAVLMLRGTNQFGSEERFLSYPRGPNSQPFISVIFDDAAAGRTSSGSTQPAARADADTVNLRNGDVLSGDILTAEFAVQASYGTLSFTKDQLASISIESQDGRTDQVVLDVGDRVSGVLQNESIEITLTSGATVTLEKGNIGSITFAAE